jgi:hypothetical protein
VREEGRRRRRGGGARERARGGGGDRYNQDSDNEMNGELSNLASLKSSSFWELIALQGFLRPTKFEPRWHPLLANKYLSGIA